MKFLIVTIMVALMALLVACQPAPEPVGVPEPVDVSGITEDMGVSSIDTDETEEDTTEEVVEEEVEEEPAVEEEVFAPEDMDVSGDFATTVEATEGDLINLDPQAVDPDGDDVSYRFTTPFDTRGLWQTRVGDAGEYIVTVSATDGQLTTEEDLLVVVYSANKPPIVDGDDVLYVKEGQTLTLDFDIYDPDGDEVIVSYSGWMLSSSKDVGYNAAGTHDAKLQAFDGEHKVMKEYQIIVENVNRLPSFTDLPSTVTAVEGDVIKLEPEASDPDGDVITFRFEAPFNSQGTWKTIVGNEGTITTTVIATDGEDEVSQDVVVIVLAANKAPIFKGNTVITVDEGEMVDLSFIVVEDPEGEDVSIDVSGWMTGLTKQTGYDDAGEYLVTITATDGELVSSTDVTVIVNDRNRPPQFIVVA